MIGEKRGFLIVVVLVILMSFSGLAGWNGHCGSEDGRCVSLHFGGNEPQIWDEPTMPELGTWPDPADHPDMWVDFDGDFTFKFPFSCTLTDLACQSFPLSPQSVQIPLTDDSECMIGSPYNSPPESFEGCWVLGGEEDESPSPDDCAAAVAPFGSKWGQGQSLLPSFGLFNLINIYGNGDEDALHLVSYMFLDSTFEYVCSDDKTWHLCDAGFEDKVAWANNKLYECTPEEYDYKWVELGEDQDHDGWTSKQGDCDDGPGDDPAVAECPVIELSDPDWSGLTLGEIRSKVKGLCNYPKHSQCAICVNPGSPEVCGDGINNDCGGPNALISESQTEPEGATSDNCHKNQASCMQEFVGHCSESNTPCILGGDQCAEDEECVMPTEATESTGICEGASPAEEGQEPAEPEVCTEDADCGIYGPCNLGSINAKNIYDEAFSWVETNEGGYCCGYNGVDDLGETVANEEGNFICLNRNLVGTESDVNGVDWIGDLLNKAIDGDSRCGDSWCWVNAISAQTKFQIVTLLKPGEEPFDVVSNNDEWFVCKEGAPATLSEPGPAEEDYEADLTKSHRFYCYDEGNRWSLAECTAEQNNRRNFGIKGRYEGEGLFSLPLVNDPTPNVEDDEVIIDEERTGKALDFHSKWYKKFYGDYNYLDFSGYDHFNFMVKFVDEKVALPAGINLKIYGPEDENGEDIVYFNGEVLGYVQNGPLFDTENYMHVKVPLGDYKAVKSFVIGKSEGAEANTLKVRNIYLSKEGVNSLCSGQDSIAQSSWLEDIDYGDPDKEIDGENLCKDLYGDTAWLGSDAEVNTDKNYANCCGNNPQEYYAGKSAEYLPEGGTSTSELQYYGCWNSQPIASGETIMDVEFEVTYADVTNVITYENIVLDPLNSFSLRTAKEGIEEPEAKDDYELFDHIFPSEATLPEGEIFRKLYTFNLTEKTFLPAKIVKGKTSFWFKDIGADNNLVDVFFYDTITGERYDKSISSLGEFIKEKSIYLNEKEVESLWGHPIAIAIQLEKKKYFTPNKEASEKPTTVLMTNSCSEDECLLALPGNPPYKITNLHPDLYELYFVTGSLPTDETLITQEDQEFTEYGNLKAKKVAQQVIFHNAGEDADLASGFYGCNAADYIGSNPLISGFFKNKPYCSAISGMFCSFSVQHEADKEKFTTIDSWSDESIAYVGYETLPAPEAGINISTYYEQSELKLKPLSISIPPEQRNHTAIVVPARNFISNAEFATLGSGYQIPHWEIVTSTGSFVENEKSYLTETGKVSLSSNEKLRSERLAVGQNLDLYLSQAQECNVKVFVVDKDGNSQPADLPQFNSGDASYVIVEFSGPCEVEKPSLQVVDELGPAEYAYQSHPELANPDARSGAACCPNNYCWNGYACVEPMGSLTTTTEHIADGRDYRCIDGAWKKSELKFDWNAQQWGFCPQESQCFVLGSGKAEHTAQSFYDGEYPICVNNTEYIFDNYCNVGNWTSRTKFLATKLLEVVENDEYVLYCSPYREALLDLGNNENYLGGEYLVTQKPTQTLAQSLQKPAQPQVLPTCFNNIKDPQGKRLVPDSQNTCINNVCILQYKDGGEFKVAFATTLNKEIDDPRSFLVSLNIPQEKLSQVCQGSGSDFIECNLDGLEFPSSADLYHSDELNALIFAQDGIQLESGVIDNIVKWFKNLFGSGLLAEKSFVTQAQNFRNIYIADVNGKKVRAVEEIFPGVRQSLVAEYQNFDTPVCEYVKNIKVPPELQLELLEQASGIEKVHCAINGTTQKVVINAGLDFFWPQLTGKLRIGESS